MKTSFVCILIVSFLAVFFGPAAKAEIVSGKTETSVVSQAGARESIVIDMVSRGIAPEEAIKVVDQMSTQEVVYFESDSSRNQPGGVVVFLLAVVVLVLLIVYLGRRV